VPRNNTSQNNSSPRNRSRTTRAASTQQRSESVEAAADMAAPSANAVASDGEGTSPTYDEIAEEAYQRYLRRGGGDGQDFDDWVEAERDLKSRRTS